MVKKINSTYLISCKILYLNKTLFRNVYWASNDIKFTGEQLFFSKGKWISFAKFIDIDLLKIRWKIQYFFLPHFLCHSSELGRLKCSFISKNTLCSKLTEKKFIFQPPHSKSVTMENSQIYYTKCTKTTA